MESEEVLGLVPLLERCQCKRNNFSTRDSVFGGGQCSESGRAKLPNVLMKVKEKRRRRGKRGTTTTTTKKSSNSKEANDDDENSVSNDERLSESESINTEDEASTSGDTETTSKVKHEFLTFKTIDLEKSKLDHSKSSKKWKERLKKAGYGSSNKIRKLILRQFTLAAFALLVAFVLKEIENNEREEEEELSATDVVYFVGTVMTTIGYGNITPITDGGKLLVTFTCLPLIAKFAYTLTALTDPLLQVARIVSSYALRVLKIKEPLDLEVNVPQMMKTLAIQTTASYGTINLSVSIPVKDLPTFFNTLSSGWANVPTRDVNKYIDEVAGEGYAESFGVSISVSEIVTLLNLIKAKNDVRSERLNMLASAFISSVVFWLGFAYFTSVKNDGWSRIDSFYFSTISLSTVGFGDFAPENTRQIAFWYVWVTLGCGIFGSMIGSFSNILGAKQDEQLAKKQLSKTFRRKDIVRKTRISLDEMSVGRATNADLKAEKKERFEAFTDMISGL